MRFSEYRNIIKNSEISEEHRERLFESLSEQGDFEYTHVEPVEVIKRVPLHRRPVFAAAASVVIAGGLIGGGMALFRGTQDDPTAPDELSFSASVDIPPEDVPEIVNAIDVSLDSAIPLGVSVNVTQLGKTPMLISSEYKLAQEVNGEWQEMTPLPRGYYALHPEFTPVTSEVVTVEYSSYLLYGALPEGEYRITVYAIDAEKGAALDTAKGEPVEYDTAIDLPFEVTAEAVEAFDRPVLSKREAVDFGYISGWEEYFGDGTPTNTVICSYDRFTDILPTLSEASRDQLSAIDSAFFEDNILVLMYKTFVTTSPDLPEIYSVIRMENKLTVNAYRVDGQDEEEQHWCAAVSLPKAQVEYAEYIDTVDIAVKDMALKYTKQNIIAEMADYEGYDYYLKRSFAVNSKGEIYAKQGWENTINESADLMAVVGDNNVVGFVLRDDLLGNTPASSEEALENGNNDVPVIINVYDSEGETVIDRFTISKH